VNRARLKSLTPSTGLCRYYVSMPTNAAQDGKFRKVSVKIKRGKYVVRTRPGYIAAK